MSENEEYVEKDEVQARIEEVIERIRNIRRPFKERRRRIVDAILGSLERNAQERRRPYRYSNPESELKKEIENLKRELKELRKAPKPRVAIQYS